jgi:MOSC domain-containing protein YiiM
MLKLNPLNPDDAIADLEAEIERLRAALLEALNLIPEPMPVEKMSENLLLIGLDLEPLKRDDQK